MPIQIVFDGDFAAGGRVSMRTLPHTYFGMQKALERSYMDITRQGLTKGERITDIERQATEFYLERYEEACFISDFREKFPELSRTIDRLSRALRDPYQLAIENADVQQSRILDAAMDRRGVINPSVQTYADALQNAEIYTPRQQGDKSINNYINESLLPLKKNSGHNSIKYTLIGNVSNEFYFDLGISNRFTRAISGKELGPELIYESYVLKMDGKNQKGVIKHVVNNKEANIYFIEASDYNVVNAFNELDEAGNPVKAMRFIGYAVRELGKLDLACGDVIFRRLLNTDHE